MIFTFWSGDVGILRPFIDDWAAFNSEFRVFDDEVVRDILRNYFPKWEGLYSRIRIPACRSDIARLVLLWQFGGFYIDAHTGLKDLTSVRQLLSLLDKYELILFLDSSSLNRGEFYLLNGALLGKQGSPVLRLLINEAFCNIKDYDTKIQCGGPSIGFNIVVVTGGWFIGTQLFDLGNFAERLSKGGGASRILLPIFRDRVKIQLADLDGGHPAFEWYKHYQYRKLGTHWSETQRIEPLLEF